MGFLRPHLKQNYDTLQSDNQALLKQIQEMKSKFLGDGKTEKSSCRGRGNGTVIILNKRTMKPHQILFPNVRNLPRNMIFKRMSPLFLISKMDLRTVPIKCNREWRKQQTTSIFGNSEWIQCSRR